MKTEAQRRAEKTNNDKTAKKYTLRVYFSDVDILTIFDHHKKDLSAWIKSAMREKEKRDDNKTDR
jgi:hypothetical protein